jgi:Rrf2 family transcriptional regulator, iron-sulfur cluster assembly transcription factor
MIDLLSFDSVKRGLSSRRAEPADTARPLLYSKTCQYALRTMERIAAAEARSPGTWVPQADLAKELSLSSPSLGQIVHRLRKSRLLIARRGPSGGVGLARPASEITVAEVVRAMDGTGLAGRCVLGFDACTDEAPCAAHPVWSFVRPLLERELEGQSLEDLIRTVEKKKALNLKKPKRAPAAAATKK